VAWLTDTSVGTNLRVRVRVRVTSVGTNLRVRVRVRVTSVGTNLYPHLLSLHVHAPRYFTNGASLA